MRVLGIDIGGTSAKVAAVHGDRTWTARSAEYANPTPAQLERAIRDAAAELNRQAGAGSWDGVGLCVPGRLDPTRTHVELSVNLPGIQRVQLSELVSAATGTRVIPRVVSDAYAAGYNFWSIACPRGRLLAISIGTGVGASVLDDGRPVLVTGETPGYLGQIEVGDGAAGPVTLENAIGARGLRERDPAFWDSIAEWDEDSPALRGLVRGLRIAHAIYRPDTIALLGYVGMRLKVQQRAIESAVRKNLTRVANADWTLAFGDSPFHAALGAARLALSPERPATGA